MDDEEDVDSEKYTQEFEVEVLGDILAETQGLYPVCATIINFLMQFHDRPDVLGYVLQIFKRLFNTFPAFRKNLEDPIIALLMNVVKAFRLQW